MVCYGLATVLHNATIHLKVDLDEEQEQIHRLKLATDPERTGPRGSEAIERDMQALSAEREEREELTDAFRGRLVQKGLCRVISNLANCKSLAVHGLLADVFLALTLNQAHRGRLVQDGAHKALLSLGRDFGKKEEEEHRERELFQHSNPSQNAPSINAQEIRRKAAHALARIGVTTDPHLFSHGAANDMVVPLLDLINGENELAQFEAALALTNLASLSPDIKLSILRNRGWAQMEFLCSSDNLQVRRAATGALCNLATCEPILEAIENKTDAGKRHVRIFLVLSQSEDTDTVKYAVSALANLAGFPPAALLIAEGEGEGLKKLVGLLRLGLPEIVHPTAHTIAALTGRKDGTLVTGEWYPPEDKAREWAKALLGHGLLPPLLLLSSSLPQSSPPHHLVGVALENLRAWWGTPLSAAEAVSLTTSPDCSPALNAWMTMRDDDQV
jgi:hypothetical protein